MSVEQEIIRLVSPRLSMRGFPIPVRAASFNLSIERTNTQLPVWLVSVYHPAFDAMVLNHKRHGLILIENTYLSSFAYNLIAAWNYYSGRTLNADVHSDFEKAIAYNFKKFFAEQVLRRTHNLFGLGIFLEGLLYEEPIMYPVLKSTTGVKTDPGVKDFPSAEELGGIAQSMTRLILYHELAHALFLNQASFKQKLLEELPKSAREIPSHWGNGKLREEFECDTFAVLLTLDEAEQLKQDRRETYRLMILGFSVFAALITLSLSAQATAENYPAESENPGLVNILSSMSGATYVLGSFPSLQRDRAHNVRRLVECIAQEQEVDLYAPIGRFQISASVVDDIERFIPAVIDCTDLRIRGKCEMLARALHGHHAGIEYLSWRSKIYNKENKNLTD